MVNTLKPTLNYREQERTENSMGFSILARYNKALSKRFAFFAEGTLTTDILNKTKNYLKETNGGITTVVSGEVNGKIGQSINLVVRPGIAYFVSSKFGVDATFASLFANYANIKPDPANGNTSQKSFSTGYSFFPAALSLGVHYYIAPKPKKQIREEEE